ncbi:MAG: hypothetical protein AAF829_11110 [Pseudomonadota bacterium]
MLSNLDPILDLEGLNAVLLGRGDLTLSTGLKPNDTEISSVCERLLKETS